MIDLMSNTTFTEPQINKRLLRVERKTYNRRAEMVLNRIGAGVALGKRPNVPEEDEAMDNFSAFMEGMEAYANQARSDNQLLKDTLEYEGAVVRLDKCILLNGQEGQEYQAPTYDPETGEELTPEVPYILNIAPLPEFITVPVYDEDGNQTGTEEIRNPEVVKDEEERSNAQIIIDNAGQEVIDLVALREEV